MRQRAEVRKERRPVPPEELQVGLEVWVAPVKRTGKVVEVDGNGKRARLLVGTVRASFSTDDLYYPKLEEVKETSPKPKAKPESRDERTAEPGSEAKESLPPLGPQTSVNTIDLRGERVEEALDQLDRYLDTAYGSRLPGVYVIHGHGTGALKEAVRRYARESIYVSAQRPGKRGEGGDGVTVLELKR